MGLYLRKCLSSGPVRLNLSKSGLGLSLGVKGARLGMGPAGTYVHAGRHGLYYRKHMSSGSGRSRGQGAEAGDAGAGCVILLLVVAAVVAGVWLIHNPAILATVLVVALALAVSVWLVRLRRRRLLAAYEQALGRAFINAQSPPDQVALFGLAQQQKRLPKGESARRKVRKIDADLYQAVLDQVLEDDHITVTEAALVRAAEQTLELEPDDRLQAKKDLFSAAYLEAIEDRRITTEELDKLRNLITRLSIPQDEVESELKILREIMAAQALRLPLPQLLAGDLSVPIQKSEIAFHQCAARVLSKRKSKDSPSGYEYTVRRDGTMVLTNKRICVVGDGTTQIRYGEIADLDVDIDEGLIEISKSGSGRPTFLKATSPLYVGRVIELLMNGGEGEE
jgi:Protein of unknown function (DUF4236)